VGPTAGLDDMAKRRKSPSLPLSGMEHWSFRQKKSHSNEYLTPSHSRGNETCLIVQSSRYAYCFIRNAMLKLIAQRTKTA
jgi:hypothetical protein